MPGLFCHSVPNRGTFQKRCRLEDSVNLDCIALLSLCRRVVVDGICPGELVAGLHVDIDVGFNGENCADGPEELAAEGVIVRYLQPGAYLLVLYDDLIVPGRVAEALDGDYRFVCAGEWLEVDDLIVAHDGEVVDARRTTRCRRSNLDWERHAKGEVRARRLMVEHDKIVVVDVGVDHEFAGVLEAMLNG